MARLAPALVSLAAALACDPPLPAATDRPSAAALPSRSTPTVATPRETAPTPASPTPAEADTVRVLLGGDVSFGRSVGQRVLGDPEFDPFAGITTWLERADVTVVNLESVLSEQQGLTEHPHNPLVFSGPPQAAGVLARAGVHLVSVANNHAWDYGKSGLRESIELLHGVGIGAAGASVPAGRQYQPVLVERRGMRIALLAFTQVWNDGELAQHAAQPFVAGPDYEAMKRALRRARAQADFVIASLHASNEYVPIPRERARRFARALLVSGADLVFGHHPHVVQGVEWIDGAPILYSLGNLLFDSRQDRAETRSGAMAVVELARRNGSVAIASLELCAVALEHGLPHPAAWDPLARELERLSAELGGLVAGPARGACGTVAPTERPLPLARRRGFAPSPAPEEDPVPGSARIPRAKP